VGDQGYGNGRRDTRSIGTNFYPICLKKNLTRSPKRRIELTMLHL